MVRVKVIEWQRLPNGQLQPVGLIEGEARRVILERHPVEVREVLARAVPAAFEVKSPEGASLAIYVLSRESV